MGNCIEKEKSLKRAQNYEQSQESLKGKKEETEAKEFEFPTPTSENWIAAIKEEALKEASNNESRKGELARRLSQMSNGEADILAYVLKRMWPQIQEHVASNVMAGVERNINISLEYISLLDKLVFTKSELGNQQPRLSNWRVVPDDNQDDIVLQVDVDYDGDCEFAMNVGSKLGTLCFGIKDVKFSGIMRIELKDLIPMPPLVSAVVAYFIAPPTIDFDLTGLANVADNPLISKTVRSTVVNAISTQLVNPHRIVVPLGAPDASIYRWPMPKYIAKITVKEAADLVDADGGALMSFIAGKSDPYVSVFMDAENQTKTPVVADNLNPKWEHVQYFRVYREDDDIQFSVFDSDIDKDDPLGNFQLALGHIDDDWLDWVDLVDTPKGKLNLHVQKLRPNVTCPKMTKLSQQVDTAKKTNNEKKVVQIYLGTLDGLLVDEPEYETKTQVYTATINVTTGAGVAKSWNLGAAAYEPKFKQTSAPWEQARHIVVAPDERVSGSIVVEMSAPTKEKREVARFDFDFCDEVQECKSLEKETSFNARIRGATFSPPN